MIPVAPEEMLERLKADKAAFRRVASLLDFNREAIMELARARSRKFDDPKAAATIAMVVHDLVSDMGDMLEAAITAHEAGKLDLSAVKMIAQPPTDVKH